MSKTTIALFALCAALAAAPAMAQTDPHHPDAAPSKPAGPQGTQTCPMVNGHMMMNGSAMGAHMQDGHRVDKDGKLIMGGMMGPNGMMCVPPQASANTQPGKAQPKADK